MEKSLIPNEILCQEKNVLLCCYFILLLGRIISSGDRILSISSFVKSPFSRTRFETDFPVSRVSFATAVAFSYPM